MPDDATTAFHKNTLMMHMGLVLRRSLLRILEQNVSLASVAFRTLWSLLPTKTRSALASSGGRNHPRSFLTRSRTRWALTQNAQPPNSLDANRCAL